MKLQVEKMFLLATVLVAGLACSSAPENAPPASAQAAQAVSPAASQDSGTVSLKIISPTPGQIVSTTDVPVTFELKNYTIEPNGQHIHVILDNEAYQPCYTTAEPFVLKNLAPGVHTIRAFPSRAWHESIKEPSAFADVTFYVEKKEGKKPANFNGPLLTYSRLKENTKATK